MPYDDDDERAYEVGYGRPPRWTQFKKGQSGNPRGRPPRKRIQKLLEMSATDKAARAELERMIQFKEGGKVQRLPSRNVLMKTLRKEALSGNTHAMKLFLNLSEGIDRRDAERAVLEEQTRQDTFETFKRLRDVRESVWREAERVGVEPEKPWPHPEDILLDHAAQECRIRGPFLEREIPLFEYMRCERDAAFGEAMLKTLDSDCPSEPTSKLLTLNWIIWDRELPLRWQFMPDLDAAMNRHCFSTYRLRRWTGERQEKLEHLRPRYRKPKIESDAKREADKILNRVIKSLGFPSRAAFERMLKAA